MAKSKIPSVKPARATASKGGKTAKPLKEAGPAGPQTDQDFVRSLAQILRETELTEIEVDRAGLRVRVSRQVQQPAYAMPAGFAPAPLSAPAPLMHAPMTTAQPAPVDTPTVPAALEKTAHPGAVTSPMVGTAYMAPSPKDPPFVAVGDTVKEGQTLMIIEAMKTMNQIPSPRSGRVKAIFIENEQPVEFGEVLMIIE